MRLSSSVLDIQSIRGACRSLELSQRPLCVHASFRSFGEVKGGPGTAIHGLLDEGCTVMVPTFADDFAIPPPQNQRPERNGWDYEAYAGDTGGIGRVFTPDTNELTVEDMGAIPAALLDMPERVRGNHPLCPFTAVGPLAHELIAGQQPHSGPAVGT